MTDAVMRHWCAVIQFPEKRPVLFGTATVRHGAPVAEVEAELTARINTVLPAGWSLVDLVPGGLFFVPEDQT